MANPIRISNLRKTYDYLKKNGLRAAAAAAEERLRSGGSAGAYRYQPPSEKQLQEQRETFWEEPLLFSVVVPAYETRPAYLEALFHSLLSQTYEHWELILADASRSEQVKRTAEGFADRRIRYFRLAENRGIAENTNEALARAEGGYVCLLDHDDVITPDALFEMAALIQAENRRGRRLRLLYSDEDKTDETGENFFEVYEKQDYNESLMLANNYICHFLVLERELACSLQERPQFDGAQDYDLILRAAAQLKQEQIGHVRKVLYHWRCHSASTAVNPRSKQYAYEAGRRAVQAYCDAKGWETAVEHTRHLGFYRIRYRDGILAQRPEIGAVGGRILQKRWPFGRARITGGLYGPDGSIRFAGLPAAFSGPMHRAVLQQDAFAVDIRAVRVQPALQPLLEQYRDRLRQACEQGASRGRKKDPGLEDRAAKELSQRFCEEVKEAGYRIVWDPFLPAEE